MSRRQDNAGRRLQIGTGAGQPAVLVSRVRWLEHLRWFYVAAIAALAAVVWTVAGQRANGASLAALAVLTAGHNVIVVITLRRLSRIPSAGARRRIHRVTNAQVAVDLTVLVSVLHFAGGARTGLAGLLVFHIAVAASLLPNRQAYLQAVFGGLLFGLLSLAEGHRLWAAVAAGALLATLLVTVYFTDAILTRLRRINRRLTDAYRQLSGLDLTKSRFLRISSHQLRGPLAAIHAMLSATETTGPVNAKQAELMQRIRERAEVMMRQLDEMLLLSTIKEDTIETTQRKAIELGGVLGEMAASFAEEAEARGVAVADQTNGQAYVAAWEDALETLCLHLLGNALRYTPSGGQVTARAHRRGRQIELQVRDTGIGIPADQKQRVFNEFFRATNARQVSRGTGLGLSIVKEIVERLGGQVRIESAVDEGTTVQVTLPVREAVEAGDASAQRQPEGRGDSGPAAAAARAADQDAEG